MRVTSRTVIGRGMLLAALLAACTPAAAEIRHLGTYSASAPADAIRLTDAEDPANIYLVDENFRFTTAASNATFSDGLAYVIDGQYLQVFDRKDLLTGPVASLDVGVELLDVEAASVGGEVLVLTRTEVKIIDVGSGSPQILSSIPATNNQTSWGNLLVRFGNTIYVTDQWLRGFRVIDITDSRAPVQVASYTSQAKGTGNPANNPVTDIRMDGRTIAFIIAENLEMVTADNILSPTSFTPLGDLKIRGITRGEMKSGYAFLADGATVHLVNVAPGSPDFLTEILSVEAGDIVTDIHIHRGRLYLLCGNVGYEVWDISDYLPR